MKIKKYSVFILIFFSLLALLTSCGHDHKYDNNWDYDFKKHWHSCSCGKKSNEDAHTYGEWIIIKEATEEEYGSKKQICSVCNFTHIVEIPKIVHQHSYDSYRNDEYSHWYECSCGYKKEADIHSFDDWIIIEDATNDKTGSKKQVCNVCGYEDIVEIPMGPHEHIYSKEFEFDETGHWYPAICNHTSEKKDFSAHNYSDWITVEPGACCNEEYEVRVCYDCGYIDDTLDDDVIHPHDYKTVAPYAPTCTKNGIRCFIYCTKCNYILIKDEIPKLGHDYSEYICTADGHYKKCLRNGCHFETEFEKHKVITNLAVDATCTEIGKTEGKYCEICDYVILKQEIIPELGHDLNYHEHLNPTCTKEGHYEYEDCRRCSYTTIETIKAIGHSFTNYLSNDNATCYSNCTETAHCDNGCGTTDRREIPDSKSPHNFTEWNIISNSTCINDGYQQRSCNVCYFIETLDIPALGHDLINHNGKPATCTSDGWMDYETCSRCNHNTYQEIKAYGHDYDYIYNNDATCTSDGTKTGDCINGCGSSSTIIAENTKLPHNYITWTIIKNATCLESGYEESYCNNCGNYATSEIKALGHDFINHEGIRPTCQQIGYNDYETCSRCDYTTYEEIEKVDHSYSNYQYNDDATCTKNGTETGKCIYNCNTTFTREVADSKLPHPYNEWIITIEATCTSDGNKERYCNVCNDKNEEVIKALGHDLINHDDKAPTCTEKGYKNYISCSRCDYNKITYLNALGHNYQNYISNNDATCTSDGTKTSYCENKCGTTDTLIDENSMLPHTYSSWNILEEATCLTVGSKESNCDVCGTYSRNKIEALGHNLINHDGKEPTCLEEGYASYETCTRCSHNTYKKLSKVNHSFIDYISDNNATCIKNCTKTGYCKYGCNTTDTVEIPNSTISHNYTKWTTIKDATCEEAGIKNGICSMCNDIKEEEINPLGHTIIEHDGKNPTCQEKGYNSYETCKICSYTTYEELDTVDHKFTNYISDNNATCLQNCTETAYCDYNCGAVNTRDINGSMLSHDYYDYIIDVEPTCLEAGSMHRYCKNCNNYDHQIISELGHDIINHEDKLPTCTESGYKNYITCSRCNYFEKTDLNELGHKISNYYYHNETHHFYYCENDGCHEKFDIEEHQLEIKTKIEQVSEGYIITIYYYCEACDYILELGSTLQHVHSEHSIIEGKEATCKESGLSYGVMCSICNEILLEQEELPPLGHLYSNGICERCGAFEYSQGLSYSLSYDSSYYIVTGLGTCSDSYVTIPSIYNNKPVKAIAAYAFQNQHQINKIIIPSSISVIEGYAFFNCVNLEFNEYDNAYYLGNDENPYLVLIAEKNKNITSCIINENTKIIYTEAFLNCPLLEEIIIPEGVTYIGDYIFIECYKLKKIAIPNSVTYLGTQFARDTLSNNTQFNEYDNAYYLGNDENPYLILMKAKSKDINSCEIHQDTKFINSFAFKDCSNITSITIPNNVISIDYFSFLRCTNLTSVAMSNSVTTIREYAFSSCTNLKNISISNNLKELGERVFMDIDNLAFNEYDNAYYLGNDENPYLILVKAKSTNIDSCNINNNTKFIHSEAFKECDSLSSILLPEGLLSIGNYAFLSCSNLSSINLPKTLIKIDNNAFMGCSSLTSIEIPEKIYAINDSTFASCSSLENLILSNNLARIDSDAFSGCSKLTNIIIPNTVTNISSNSFNNCDNLAFNEYDNAYYLGNNENPYLILIKAKSTDITSCQINNQTKFIHSEAFNNCENIADLIIPNNILKIGSYAFDNCNSLATIYYENTSNVWNSINGYYYSNINIYFYLEEEPSQIGNYWHYDNNNNPIIW